MPPFSLYNVIGKLTVIFELCQSESGLELTQNQRDLIDWFHNFIFTETLQFHIASLTKDGCRVVLLKDSDCSVTSNEPSNIDFSKMELLKRNACESNGRYSRSDTDLLDSIVIKDYLPQTNPDSMRHYMVISTGGNPFSKFPDQKKAKTFKEYFETKCDLTIRDLSQPLVEVILYSREIDCRLEKVSGKKSGRDGHENDRLIPELLKFRTSPQSLTLRALFLPAILYRLNSLVSLSQLQEAVVREMFNSSCACDTLYIPPEKKLKSSSGLENLSVNREGGSNQVTMVDTYQLLSKYFRPLDNSKSVPLLQLLEAVTSASAGENFNLERLEMLGDSFLKMAVSIHVHWHKHYKDEGKLTKYRQRQISNKNLFNLAHKRHLPGYINHSIFTKQTWIPPGFTLLRSKGENDNNAIYDVIHKDKGREDRKGIMNLNPTDDVRQNDVMHVGTGDCEMPDDVDDDVRYDSTTDNVMHGGVMHKVVSDEAVQEITSDYAKDESSPDDVMHDGTIHDATSDKSVKELASVDNFKHDCRTVDKYGTTHDDATDKAICKDASDSVKFDNTTDDVTHDDTMHDATSDDHEAVKEIASVDNLNAMYKQGNNTVLDAASDTKTVKELVAKSDVKYDSSTDDDMHNDIMHDNALCKTARDDVMKQEISDKCVADSVEALIGAHFMHCGYMGALVFMTWLGLDVFHRDVPSSEYEKLPDDRHRKSPLESYSKYANYPTLDIPKESSMVLKQQTREMEAFEEKIGYTFKNKVCCFLCLAYIFILFNSKESFN